MKNYKELLMVFIAAIMLSSCTEEVDPPVAGFTLSSNSVVSYDEVTITSTATGENIEISYKIHGGDYYMDDETLAVTFLNSGPYTIEQNVFNGSGSNSFTADVVVTEPNNTYTLDGIEMPITNLYYDNINDWGDILFMKIYGDGGFGVTQGVNLIQLSAVSGTTPVEGTYNWENEGPIGTYDLNLIYNFLDGGDLGTSTFDWFTHGDNGANLVIDLVFENTQPNALNIYDITLSTYNLNVGYWDYNTNPETWVSEGNKTLSFYYRGAIVPLQ